MPDIDWGPVLRRCAKEFKMPPWDVARLTMTQILAMLERPESSGRRDPHAGQDVIRSQADLDAAWEEWEEEFG